MIILEGPDGGGKTTLARKLIERLGHGRIHHEGPPTTGERILQRYASLLVNREADVYDRLHVGECVYGPIIRRRDLLGPLGFQLLDKLIASLDGTMIYCLPNYETAVRNWRARHSQEYVGDEDQYCKIYEAYWKITTIPHIAEGIIYDYTANSLEMLLSFHNRLKVVAHEGCLGSPIAAEVLIVGEIANHKTLDLPFFSVTGSSGYLHGVLAEAGWELYETMLVNARTLATRKNRDLKQIWQENRRLPVIALGKVAEGILREQGVPVAYSFPHPAYWKRFHAVERTAYVSEFRRARQSILRLPD